MLRVKHALDRTLAFLGLVVLSPLIVGIALWVQADTGGPVLIRQVRAGKDGRPFGMLKFRTMVVDAVEVGRKLGLGEDPFGVVPDDPRITRSGRFLRRTSLDELPQLWNVLRGEMSLVGPRPDLVEQVANYAEADRRRLSVRPGITGWSQVHGRDEITWPERFAHDAWYVENWSLLLDVKILLKTLAQVARPEPRPVEDRMNIKRLRSKGPQAEVTIVEEEAEDWDGLLDELGARDVYFRYGYAEASSKLDGGRPVLLHAGNRSDHVLLVCSLRSIPGEQSLNDVTTPYGYGGPLVVGEEPPVQAFWDLYEAWCAENHVVSTFLRFHPLLGNQSHAPRTAYLETLASTVTWRVDGTDDLFESMHRHHRRVVRKAESKLDLEVHEGPDSLDSFRQLYEATMRRQDAADFYFFPPAYWEALVNGLRDHLVRFDAFVDGDLVASALCLAAAPWIHYHLGATLDRGRSVGGGQLLLLEAARWARARGYERFNLGGGVGGREDSLWEYKRRFAPEGRLDPWMIGKMVHDESAYLALSGAETVDFDGFFPTYRARTSHGAAPPGKDEGPLLRS